MSTTKMVHGSWRNQVVASCLLEERAKKDFSGSLNEIGCARDLDLLREIMAF